MKKVLFYVTIMALCYATAAGAQSLGCLSLPTLGGECGDLTVKAYTQVGYQHVGSNISLPTASQLVSGTDDLQIDTLDISVQDANFWTGIIGVNAVLKEKYSFFAAAGGNLNREFITAGTIPVSLNGVATSASLDFTNSGLNAWFVQTGVGLGPILAGLYWDKFTIRVADPRSPNGPLANQTLRGDFVTTTFCPFIGLALPVSQATLMVTYSPFAMANSTLALRSSNNGQTDLQYTWDKPGTLITASVQYNQEVSKSVYCGLWASYLWMNQRGGCSLSFVHNGTTPITSDRGLTATMTKYVLQGGVTLGVNF